MRSSFGQARCMVARPVIRGHGVGCQAQVAQLNKMKNDVIDLAGKLNRGLGASDQDKSKMEDLVQALERVNPHPESLEAAEINGRWRLIYTTSESILGTKRPAPFRPSGPIFQTIDAKALRAQNNEGFPFFNAVTADLTPVSKSQVNVQFDTFKIGNFVPVKAPPSAKGWLDTTFVDSEMRISRGDKGNLFVLTMDDPTVTLA